MGCRREQSRGLNTTQENSHFCPLQTSVPTLVTNISSDGMTDETDRSSVEDRRFQGGRKNFRQRLRERKPLQIG